LRVCLLEHLQRRLHVALGGTLVVGLGEPLGGDQLVLELGRVPVPERVPVRGPVETPKHKRAPRGGSGRRELVRERGRSLHVDRDHRSLPGDVVGEDPQQRGRLAGATGAEDQAVGRQLLV
jgi:hypothetical protein